MPKKKPSRLQTNSKTKTFPELESIRVLFILLMIIVIIAIVSVVREFYPPQTPIVSLEPNPNQQEVTITGPNAFFYTKVFLDRDKTFVSFPFKPPSPPQLIWLFLVMQEGTPHTRLLISHPVISTLEWESITDDFATLYQKVPRYDSIDDFLSNPPTSSQTTVLMDPYLSRTNPYQEVPATAIPERDDNLNLDGIDYILTTYHAPRIGHDGFHYYETTLNAQLAQLNDSEQLIWQILAPQANQDNPLTIGTIHVDYRQY